MKQAIIAILVVVGIIGGAVVFGKDDTATAGVPSNNFYGQEDGIVTVLEYGDFECPACAAFFPIASQVKEQFKDQIRFEFRHFPLVQIHGNAQAAHRASQAAANQDMFWEMHDLLYERQNSWNTQATSSPSSIFEGYAEELGFDMEKFNTDVAAAETLGTINADIALGKDIGVTGTPTFVIDGQKIEDTATIDSAEEFAALITAAIEAKESSADVTSEGVDSAEVTTEPAKPEDAE